MTSLFQKIVSYLFILLIVGGAFQIYASTTNGTINATNHSALLCMDDSCATTTGINFLTTNGREVHVTSTGLTGDIWSEQMGWINLDPTNGGVTNTNNGELGGYAWGENAGWINFNPSNGGVNISTAGKFIGWAWAENYGWIRFNCSIANACVETDWRPGSGGSGGGSTGGGGGGEPGIDICPNITGEQSLIPSGLVINSAGNCVAPEQCNVIDGALKQPLDVVIIIDRSGSMAGTKMVQAKNAAVSFINNLVPGSDRVSYVNYSNSASLVTNFSSSFSTTKTKIQATTVSGATNIGAAVKTAYQEIYNNGRDGVKHVIILLSDGEANVSDVVNLSPNNYAISRSNIAKLDGTIIYSIGLGTSIDTNLMKKVATLPSYYYSSPTGNDLSTIYLQIAALECTAAPSKIVDMVVYDQNANGLYNPGEIGLGGSVVSLTSTDGSQPLRTATSGADGIFNFLTVPPGPYSLCNNPPVGMYQTSPVANNGCYNLNIIQGINVTTVPFLVAGNVPDFCTIHPTDPTCIVPDYCTLHPNDQICLNPNFCTLYPNDPSCQQPDFCTIHPTDPTCQGPVLCTIHPNDPTCLNPDFCTLNPNDPTCIIPSYCTTHPNDPTCQGPDICILHPNDIICQTPDYCTNNPNDPTCQEPDLCTLHPNDIICQDPDFCTLYPNDLTCQTSTFCNLHPNDPACDDTTTPCVGPNCDDTILGDTTLGDILNTIQDGISDLLESINYNIIIDGTIALFKNPVGKAVTGFVGTVGAGAGLYFGVVNVAFSGPVALSEIFLTPLRIWSLLMAALGFRKRRVPWGTVYDSVTKQPIDPAYVVLQDLNGNEVATSITDLDGRYGFLVPKGQYRIIANKTNYEFPSKKLAGRLSDELYQELYFNEIIDIKEDGEVITKNIPMDPIKFDWNEFAKKDKKLMKFYSRRDVWVARITDFLFAAGFIITIISVLVSPIIYNFIILALYLLMLVLKKTLLKPRAFGYIKEKNTNNPLSFAVIRVFFTGSEHEVIHKVTDMTGKYYCLVPNGKYYTKIENKNLDQSYNLVHTSESIEVKKGYINKKFEV
jgi:uncharacterized protein YegL